MAYQMCPRRITGRSVVVYLVTSFDASGEGALISDIARHLAVAYYSPRNQRKHYANIVVQVNDICEELIASRLLHMTGQRLHTSPIINKAHREGSSKKNHIHSGFDLTGLIGRSVILLLLTTVGRENGLTAKDLLKQIKHVLEARIGFFSDKFLVS
ncbi:hypothetical protein Bpfe_003171, partial [Biomphalaria pfeifferi]